MYLRLLKKHIKWGTLDLRLPDGQTYRFGQGLPHVEWIINNSGTLRKIARDPEFMLGETYVNGEWRVGRGTLVDLIEVLMRNVPERMPRGPGRILAVAQKLLQQWNRISRSYSNVSHHYDMDEWLFRRFLDDDLQYSCAYFETPDMSLEQAQQAKCRHIMNKLQLKEGQRVLDIGSGWGGLAMFLARNARVRVTGLTLSQEQLRVARKRASEHGLERLVDFRLEDYREHRRKYDCIVSVGMFEHVGRPNYRTFLDHIGSMLRRDGIALLHTIGRLGPAGNTNPWIQKYIFPGGYNPALSEVSAALEHSGLITSDVEVLRLHYARTLAEWQRRFQASRAEVAERMGEQFCRTWEFYLASCEGGFRWRDLVVFQLQLAHRRGTVPLTRDYLYPVGKQRAGTLGIPAPAHPPSIAAHK